MKRRELLKKAAFASAVTAASNAFTQRALSAANSPKRLVIWYVPEGCAQQAFWPAQAPGRLVINEQAVVNGGDQNHPESKELPIQKYASPEMGTYCLQPLINHLNDITLISGFRNDGAKAGDPHKTVVQNALTGGIPNEGSFDQHVGPALQGDTPDAAIFSSLYGNHVKGGADYRCPWRAKGGGTANLNWNPVQTYNRIFPTGIQSSGGGGGVDSRLISRKAILNAVTSRLDAVRCEGGREAQERMEAYLESFETVEKRTQVLIDNPFVGEGVTVDIPNGWTNINNNNKYWNNHNNFGTLARIQIDTTIAALALDRTRVSVMQFSATGNGGGNLNGGHYGTLGLPALEGGTQDHNLGHSPTPSKRRDQAKIFRWYYSQLAYMVDRMKAIPDGDGTLFDNTLIMCCSEFGMYDHRTNDIPYILLGNPGGAFRKGEYLDAYKNGVHRPHADLFLAVAKGLGVNMNRFGISTTPYNDILV